jgi:hypothetical protein
MLFGAENEGNLQGVKDLANTTIKKEVYIPHNFYI